MNWYICIYAEIILELKDNWVKFIFQKCFLTSLQKLFHFVHMEERNLFRQDRIDIAVIQVTLKSFFDIMIVIIDFAQICLSATYNQESILLLLMEFRWFKLYIRLAFVLWKKIMALQKNRIDDHLNFVLFEALMIFKKQLIIFDRCSYSI